MRLGGSYRVALFRSRAERAVKRNFTALKTLLGENPLPEASVKQKLTAKIETKRQPATQSRDAEEKCVLPLFVC